MKRLLTSTAMLLCSLLTFAQFSGTGSGIETDPYRISNPYQLNELRNFLNKEGVYFILMRDIDLEEFLEEENPSQGWLPIGPSDNVPFKGVLDGNGKTISGLWINREKSGDQGFFGHLSKAIVKDLTLKGTVKGNKNVGLLAGISRSSTISNCTISGIVSGEERVGGLVGGCENPTISNINSTIDINCTGEYAGGIIGYLCSNGSIKDCSVKCNSVKGTNYTGGIVGFHKDKCTISSCYVYSNIYGNENVGGIAGKCGYSITDCGFIGDVTSMGNNVGGISGEQNGLIYKCFAIGHINTTGDKTGGLAGYSSGEISSSYFSGSISGGERTGGIVGDKYGGTTHFNYSKATIAGKKSVGGLCGYIGGTYSYDAYLKSNAVIASTIKATDGNVGRIYGSKGDYVTIGALGTTSEENKAYNRAIIIDSGIVQDVTDGLQDGTSVSATTLKYKATYVAMGWDFTDTWTIQETECYPYMKTQTAPPVIKSKAVSGATVVHGNCIDGGTIVIEIDGVKQQMVSAGNTFSFDVDPLQAGHEIRIGAKADGKEQSYYTSEIVSFLGKGSADDPYQIYTAADLTCVYRRGYYKLMNDIDLTDYIKKYYPTEGWESIGREGSETIHFDGDGHKVTGLWSNSTRDNTGLFSCFANGTIKNLTVETAQGKQVKGGKNTGILIGKIINGTIENCQVIGNVADGTPVGGMVGLFDGGKISLSQSSVTISTTGKESYVGGLIGEMTSGEIDQCITQGSITAAGINSYAGGVIGLNHAALTNCYSNAMVTATLYSAGIAGYNYDVVDKCYATGDIVSSKCGAGIIGYNDGENAVVKNCVAMNNKIDLTYESQQEEQGGRYGMRIVGGYKNGAPTPELNNYALNTMQVSTTGVPQKVYDDFENGVAKSAAELTDARTYQEIGWDFADIWFITEGESYPSLRNNPATVSKPNDNPTELPISVEESLSVKDVSAYKGKSISFAINLTNKATNLSAYQFDLTLPTGITLGKDDKGNYKITKTSRYEDANQTINIDLIEGNTYRIMCYSLSNLKITGADGALFNAMISVDKEQVAGNYKGKIENIVFTKTNGDQMKLNNVSFNIEVFKAMKGDANADGDIDVTDVVEIVKAALNKPTDRFVKQAADMNDDNAINVTDVVMVVNIIMSGDTYAARTRNAFEETGFDRLSLLWNSNNSYSLDFDNKNSYIASQFDIKLSEGMSLEAITLNKNRSNGHMITYAEIENNVYRVMVYSTSATVFDGNGGELINFVTSGSGNIEVENILFVTGNQNERRFDSLFSERFDNTNSTPKKVDIFSIDGRLVRSQAESTEGLQKGIYVINGKKHVVK